MAGRTPPGEPSPNGAREPGRAAQWTGLLLAPAAFFAHLQIAYVLVPHACRGHTDLWLHVVGVAGVLLATLGTVVAWHVWSAAGRHASTEPGGAIARARFLGLTGFVMGGLFVLLLAAQWLVAFAISPCQ